MMLLAVDTTAAIATAALFRDDTLIEEREADASKKHAETVLPLIDELLEQNGVVIGDIDLFAVDIGPGSFTGVRIGVSLVNALAFATGKSIIPVDALLTLATAIDETKRPVCTLIDARNGNAYAALYQAGQEKLAPEGVELESFLTRIPADAVFVGDIHVSNPVYPRASDVGHAALQRLETARDTAEPLYLRPSQAERLKKPSGEA